MGNASTFLSNVSASPCNKIGLVSRGADFVLDPVKDIDRTRFSVFIILQPDTANYDAQKYLRQRQINEDLQCCS